MTEEKNRYAVAARATSYDAVTTWATSIVATGSAWYFGAPLWTAPILLYGMVTFGYTNMRVFQLASEVRLMSAALTESDWSSRVSSRPQ